MSVFCKKSEIKTNHTDYTHNLQMEVDHYHSLSHIICMQNIFQ